MRAMLVSFASNHLWLHWRQTGLFLARQFLDFEPGIHWSQMQMQSGTTGINTLRIYSPTKQAHDHDPQGVFIRQWVPELADVPLPNLVEPWKMDLSVQRASGCIIDADYPAPIVNEKAAAKAARDSLYRLRKSSKALEEAQEVQARHGSRISGLPPSGKRRTVSPKQAAEIPGKTPPPAAQGDLFAWSASSSTQREAASKATDNPCRASSARFVAARSPGARLGPKIGTPCCTTQTNAAPEKQTERLRARADSPPGPLH
jgi:deoxyribodipyrimidine photo-lyase